MWNNCSLVLPNFEYCLLNWFSYSCHVITIGSNKAYHNLDSPISVKQNLQTFTPSGKSCVFIQSFVLNKWASTSSSGLPEYSGLKWDQFICIWTCWPSCGSTGCGVGWGGGGSSLWGQGLAVHLLPSFFIYIFAYINYTTNLLNLAISRLYSSTITYLFTDRKVLLQRKACKLNVYLLSKCQCSFNTNSHISSGVLFQEILPSLCQ